MPNPKLDLATKNYTAAQAHDAYAQYIEGAIQGSLVEATDIAYGKCLAESREVLDFRHPELSTNLVAMVEYALSNMSQEYTAEQKLWHILAVHLHRAIAVSCAISIQQEMHYTQP